MGAVGSPYDNAVVESFWARMQVELLNRKTYKTRIELATAIHDYIELFHNTRRRHSSAQAYLINGTRGRRDRFSTAWAAGVLDLHVGSDHRRARARGDVA